MTEPQAPEHSAVAGVTAPGRGGAGQEATGAGTGQANAEGPLAVCVLSVTVPLLVPGL